MIAIGMLTASSCDDETIVDPPHIIPVVYPDIDDRPRWSPDGTRIVYFHSGIVDVVDNRVEIDPSERGLWMIDTLGTETFLLRSDHIHGEISGAGDKLAFSNYNNIYVANISADGIDTLSIRQLTAGGSDHFPAWSPADSLIAYETNADGKGYRVHLIDADSEQKAAFAFPSRYPDWFPDGKRLVYFYNPPGAAPDIAVFSLQDSTILRLTDNGFTPDYLPQVSPAGDRILYQRGPEVWVMDADGSNRHFVVRGHDPTWAPDGRRLAFVYWPDASAFGLGTIWMTNTDRSFLKELTKSTIQYPERLATSNGWPKRGLHLP